MQLPLITLLFILSIIVFSDFDRVNDKLSLRGNQFKFLLYK